MFLDVYIGEVKSEGFDFDSCHEALWDSSEKECHFRCS